MLNINSKMMWKEKNPGFAMQHRSFSFGEGVGG